MKKENRIAKEKDKQLFAILILFFPTIMIVAVSNIASVVERVVYQLLLALFQVILLKNYTDEMYKYND
jgi:methenyltetrahydromethanopterin cyclohydrolase